MKKKVKKCPICGMEEKYWDIYEWKGTCSPECARIQSIIDAIRIASLSSGSDNL